MTTTLIAPEIEVVELPEPEKAIPCEIQALHRGDNPAIYVVTFSLCACYGDANSCQSCFDLMLENEALIVNCGRCPASTVGPIRRLIVRVEPIK